SGTAISLSRLCTSIVSGIFRQELKSTTVWGSWAGLSRARLHSRVLTISKINAALSFWPSIPHSHCRALTLRGFPALLQKSLQKLATFTSANSSWCSGQRRVLFAFRLRSAIQTEQNLWRNRLGAPKSESAMISTRCLQDDLRTLLKTGGLHTSPRLRMLLS